MKSDRARIAVLTFAALVILVASGAAQVGTKKSLSGNASTRGGSPAAAREESSGRPQEGIKVHGHWTIVIKNPDGSVASRNEFENALVNTGSDILAQLLARTTSTGAWGVSLIASGAGNSSCGGSAPCFIVEPNAQTGAITNSTNLTVTYSANPSRSTLQGSYQASSAGDVAQVITVIGSCPGNVAPSTCPTTPNNFTGPVNFSSRALASPIAVQTGQIVQITVTFTFS